MPDCPGLCDNTEPFIEFDDVTASDPIPMVEYTIDPDARQVIPFVVVLKLGDLAGRDPRDTTRPFTGRPCTMGCFDRY